MIIERKEQWVSRLPKGCRLKRGECQVGGEGNVQGCLYVNPMSDNEVLSLILEGKEVPAKLMIEHVGVGGFNDNVPPQNYKDVVGIILQTCILPICRACTLDCNPHWYLGRNGLTLVFVYVLNLTEEVMKLLDAPENSFQLSKSDIKPVKLIPG